MSRWILHADLDQFLAAAELLRHPELSGRPLIVGGSAEQLADPRARTVVATASYEARALGVGSGTPMHLARRRLAGHPEAVFLPSDTEYYERVSARVVAQLRDLGEPVETIGWDESFLGTDGDPWDLAHRIRAAVATTGLSCAVGIGDNTLRAKTATGYAKPGGIHELTAANWFATLGADPPTALPGIGRQTAKALGELGITTVTQLAEARPGYVAERLGPHRGPYYVSLGRGIGRSELDTGPWAPRSRSRETTFPADLTDHAAMRGELATLAHRVAADIAVEGRDCVRIGIRVRTRHFRTTTRSRALHPPGRDGDVFAAVAGELLDELAPDRPIRLLGVRAELAEPG